MQPRPAKKTRKLSRAILRKRDLNAAYAFALEHSLGVQAVEVTGDGSFILKFGDPLAAAPPSDIDRELALLEAKHGRPRT